MLPGWIIATWKYKEWTLIFISGNKSDHLTFTAKPPMKGSYTATVLLPCNTDLYLFLLNLVWDITTIILKDTHCDAVELHIMGLDNISTSWFALCHWEDSTEKLDHKNACFYPTWEQRRSVYCRNEGQQKSFILRSKQLILLLQNSDRWSTANRDF